MVNCFTDGIHTACIDTWITAFLIVATAIVRAVIIGNTFRVCANSATVDHATMSVMVAWRWIAWVNWFSLYGFAFNEWITSSLWWT